MKKKKLDIRTIKNIACFIVGILSVIVGIALLIFGFLSIEKRAATLILAFISGFVGAIAMDLVE